LQMMAFFSQRVLHAILIAITLLYAVAEWHLAATISGSSIFNRQRNQQTLEFRIFVDEISRQISSACASGRVTSVLFDDDDVALPYLINRNGEQRRCTFTRETAVTPFGDSALGSCSTMLIVEQHLPHPPRGKSLVIQDKGLTTESHWASENGDFSFSVYSRRGCSTEAEPR
jgi:hypothetical protein